MSALTTGTWSTRRVVAVATTGAIAAIVVLGVVFVTIWYRSWSVPSEAMKPTLPRGSHFWTRPIDRAHVKRDDIVVLVPPGRTQTVVTRVVAIGGDVIETAKGRVTLNGIQLAEGFLESGMTTPDFERTTVPDGTVFVLGDNRINSVGSPMYGPVPLANLREHVVRTDTPAPALLLTLAALSLVPLLLALVGPRLSSRARRDMAEARDALVGSDPVR